MPKIVTLDPVLAAQITSAAGAAVTSVASWSLGDWSLAILGVPLTTVLAAFAGAILQNTFMPVQGLYKLLSVLAAGTLVGSYMSPLVISITSTSSSLEKPIAFALGFAVQVLVPTFFARIKATGGPGNGSP